HRKILACLIIQTSHISPWPRTLRDLSVTNTGFLTEGNKKHFRVEDVSQFDTGEYLAVRTLEKENLIAYGKSLIIEKNGSRHFAKDVAVSVRLKKNETVCLTNIVSVFVSKDKGTNKIKPVVKGFLKKSIRLGFDRMIKEHIASWDKLWLSSDVKIKGRPDDEKALRFNMYHLLIAGREGNGESSIGAKTLSGEGYRGHIFWDADIFILPFFIYNRPKVAKNMLLYRYNRLNKARKIAESLGYKGAMFPWESADTGEECTPAWARNFDGSIIQIRTHEMEHHISADIAYGVYQYYVATQDERFMLKHGFEMIFETARFWASRTEYNSKIDRYEIKHVIGPDEFHEDVNNNAYTNCMARFNLLVAYGMYQKMKRLYLGEFMRLSKDINLRQTEIREWKKIISKIGFNIKNNGLIEQFDGFFKMKKIELKNLKRKPIPPIPKSVDFRRIGSTQLIKQADVVMLLYLLSDSFSKKIKKKNFYYYLKRTLHKSSLSAAVHAALAVEIGDIETAYRYFYIALNMDLSLIYGNTDDGMHAASLGVSWQAAISGFAGTRVLNGTLSIDPLLPEDWREMDFCMKWQGYDFSITVSDDSVRVWFPSKRKKDRLKIMIYGVLHRIEANKKYVFTKRGDSYVEKK
ncbi:glycoside hydrolase family 65 protein, partial [Candidatus Omnitrophota bacterium]